jgi:hypothetical protein
MYTTVLSTEIVMGGGWEVDILPDDPTFASLQFAFWVPSSYTYSTATCVACLEFGSWTHFVAVVDGAALTATIFHDGLEDKSTQVLGPFTTGLSHLWLGRWETTGRQLVGVLDEVAIFDRTLSAAEVTQLYAGGGGLLP